MNRRYFIAAALGAGASLTFTRTAYAAYEVTRSDAEWKAMLTPLQYKVMRKAGTEKAGSSPLDKIYNAGTFHCRGCDLAVYSSKHKFDSGTGWPSFYQSLSNAVKTENDYKLVYPRTEVHCRRCGSHFGHIFNDGPKPTGKRHCLNGASLVFKAA
ncbi:peptide-methionine (R)-S-oxide reductase MsrB [Lentibacter algarum]|uniref:peptide-methionine (R)-S-oxide reductase MsrB n=1 Tax=Lentibacter algarum TaxID=576131 RepID=UPI001C092A0D|nr:peptide-methionine (R)-S-oxide reductase MsrB [Lentibacter algarum]MBU2982854.1 peptide-methionine (R)-S-oxide reductase MsrB [Lentibacter algarum]